MKKHFKLLPLALSAFLFSNVVSAAGNWEVSVKGHFTTTNTGPGRVRISCPNANETCGVHESLNGHQFFHHNNRTFIVSSAVPIPDPLDEGFQEEIENLYANGVDAEEIESE